MKDKHNQSQRGRKREYYIGWPCNAVAAGDAWSARTPQASLFSFHYTMLHRVIIVLIIRSKGRGFSPRRIRVIDRESFIKLSRFFSDGIKSFSGHRRQRNIAKRGIINFSSNVQFSARHSKRHTLFFFFFFSSVNAEEFRFVGFWSTPLIDFRVFNLRDMHHYNSTSPCNTCTPADDVISKQADIFITRTVFIVTVHRPFITNEIYNRILQKYAGNESDTNLMPSGIRAPDASDGHWILYIHSGSDVWI